VRPNANLANYRRVVVDPGQASLASDWLKSMNQQRTPGRWVTREDAQRLQDEAASSLAPIVSEAFRAQGYELVTAPGPGVLRISPRVSDLYVNAPDTYDSGIQRYVVRDAGQATLHLEVRDAATGEVVARVIDRSTAKEINRNFNRATNSERLGCGRRAGRLMHRLFRSTSTQKNTATRIEAVNSCRECGRLTCDPLPPTFRQPNATDALGFHGSSTGSRFGQRVEKLCAAVALRRSSEASAVV